MASEPMMTSCNPSSSSSQSSLSRSGDETDWKERCQALETSLIKFKQQAARIRELLADKMHDNEAKTQVAEKRAADAEEKNKTLEQQLSAITLSKPGNGEKRVALLEKECREKDKIIQTLRLKTEEQKNARLCEAKLVEEKSLRIKEWVTKKISDFEYEAHQMRTENTMLRDQLSTLQARLQALPSAAAREIHRISMESSSRPLSDMSSDSLNPPVPKRPSSSIMESVWKERELEQLKNEIATHMSAKQSLELEENMADNEADLEADYQEIDDNHESKYEPKLRGGPPQVKIERKVFPNPRLNVSSLVSSTTGSEELLDRVDALPGSTYPSPLAASATRTNSVNQASQPPTSLGPLPKFRPAGGARVKEYTRGEEKHLQVSPPPLPYSNRTVSALATLPRRKKDANKYCPPIHNQIYEAQTMDRRLLKKATSFERSMSERGRAKPPTPPMRRLPSWENRIYAIANIGMKAPDNGLITANRESSFPVTDGLYTDRMYQDLMVPVYTTLRGKAAQIRSTPFTGDSTSESSDEDEAQTQQGNEAVMSIAGPSGLKTATSVTMKNSIEDNSRAPKRGVSSHSIASETSSDYAVPPDDEVSIKSSSSENTEPEHKLLKYTTETLLLKDCSEKCGYLKKLGGKEKNWKRWWFVLKNGELLYYKSPNDITGKPQGHISFNNHTRIAKTESVLTFEIATLKRTFYFTADYLEEMENWIKVMQNVLKDQAADRLLAHGRVKEIMKGWLIKTRHGRNRRCWCVLMGKFFMYYKSPSDKTPLGQIHLRECMVEEVDRSCDSESDSDDSSIPDYTLAIIPKSQAPTYLMILTRHEKESWLYHLTVATGGGSGKVGTEYEQLISRLMEQEGDLSSTHWKNPLLLHTKEPLPRSLTTLPSEDLTDKALDLFKLSHSFMNIVVESQQLDYHVSLSQSILDMCLQYTELQDELICQLIKQTSRHAPQTKSAVQAFLLCGSHSWFTCDASPTSPTNSVMDLSDSKLNPQHHVFVQGWQLLAMSLSVFLPKQSILWYLKAHLQRNADPRTEVGKYAVFCQRALERSMHNGGREARPSRMEVLSILLRNPYHHSQPISIPVHFLNGSYQVISFDGSTSVQEFLQTLNKTINVRDCALSGFALFTDDPAGHELEHCLKGHLKLCDVISKWEQALFHHASQHNRVDTNRCVKLTYKNRLYFKSLSRHETEKERLLLVYQINEEVVNGRFPLNRELAIELASLLAHVEYGDYRVEVGAGASGDEEQRIGAPHSSQHLPSIIERFYPKRYRRLAPTESRLLEQMLKEKWANLRSRTIQECVRIYLTVTRKWPYFGAKLFSARFRNRGDNPNSVVWLAVHEDGVSVLEYGSLKAQSNFSYKSVITFGGCRDDFMLVVSNRCDTGQGHSYSKTDKLLFSLSKPKILDMTLLMVSYINIKGQHKQMQTQSLPYMPPVHTTSAQQMAENYSRATTLPRPCRPKPTVASSSMDM